MKRTTETTESILIECDLPEPPEKVWRALTEPELLGKWLMPSDLCAQVGARFRFRPDGAEGNGTPIDCEMLAVEPRRRLQWVQREQGNPDTGLPLVESVVTLELAAIPNGGTRLRVVHDGFAGISCTNTPEILPTRASAAVVDLKARRIKAQSCRRRPVAGSRIVSLLRRAA